MVFINIKEMENDFTGISFNCLRCNYEWTGYKRKPKRCPYCQSYSYDKPRLRKINNPIIYKQPEETEVIKELAERDPTDSRFRQCARLFFILS